jgi:hypothetical protein
MMLFACFQPKCWHKIYWQKLRIANKITFFERDYLTLCCVELCGGHSMPQKYISFNVRNVKHVVNIVLTMEKEQVRCFTTEN